MSVIKARASGRLEPRPWHANYLHLRSLAAQIRRGIDRHLAGRDGLRLLDVGCGDRPYETLFASHVSEYVGVDYAAGPKVDQVLRAEKLPFPDVSFDCVLCSQVLEHVEDPYAVSREISRVLRPGGVAMVSTHGVVNYHPNPDDYWRWTHAGLERLLRMTGGWGQIEVWPNGGTASALAYLIGRQAEVVASKTHGAGLIPPLIFGLNVASWNLDRAYRRAYPDRPPDLSPNYLVVAVRDGAV